MAPAIGAAAVKAFFVKLIIAVAVNVIVNKITKAMQKRPVRVLQQVDVAYTGGLQPRRILFGDFRAAGLEVIPASTSGLTGNRLHKMLAMSEGDVESFDAFNYNNDRITASQLTNSITGGSITSGTYAGFSQIFPHLGSSTQLVDNNAVGAVAGWTTEHRGRGVAYVYMFFDASNDVYKAGAPNVVIEGKGAKIYDPRLDVSPGASPTNSSYIAFSKNPALQLVRFLTWDCGGAESTSLINWADVVTAANACEQSVTIPNGSGGTTTQNRYTSSIEVYAPQNQKERDDTIAMLARAMMGACWFADGKWRMRAGVYTSAVALTVTDDDFLGESLNVATAISRASSGVFNTVRGSYVDQVENTQPKSFPEISSSAYIATDGEVMYTDVEFRTARTAYEAQRNAILLLRQSRRRVVVAGTLRFKFSGLELYDVVNVTLTKLGWVSQPCRVVRIRHYQNFTVGVELQEIASTDFTDPITTDYTIPGSLAPIVSTSYAPNAPSNLAATAAANGIIFNWSPPAQAPIGVLYQLFEYTSATPFASATQVGSDTSQTSIVVPKTDTTVRYYWVRAKDPQSGAVSTQSPPSNGVPGNAASASGGLSALVAPGSATVSGFTSSLTTGACAVTASGGTAPYTYSWTFTAGGTGITITSSTSASTTFSSSGLAQGDVKSGTARCRVTDNVAATFDVSVSVTITRQFNIVMNNVTVSATGSSTSAAVTSFTVANSGAAYASDGQSFAWLPSGATASGYDVRFTLNSGTLQSGTTSTWLNLASSWQVTGSRGPGAGSGTSTQNLTVEIRDASTLTVLATGTLIMNQTIP